MLIPITNEPPQISNTQNSENIISNPTSPSESTAIQPSSGNELTSPSPNPPPARTHPMITRSQNNIYKPKNIFSATKHPLQENLEPSGVTKAMRHNHWRKAMSEEFDALLRNGTWQPELAPHNHNIVGCKWLFCIKRNPDGTISRYKARLVAKGFTQTMGVDFKETFSPVIKSQTIKVILTLALAHSWPLH